jgi:imidazolonepropionase-like amidohydrolase
MTVRLTRRSALLALAGGAVTIATARAQQAPPPAAKAPAAILISNVRIFDGVGDQLRPGNLMIVGSKIKQISPDPITAPPESTVIDGSGRVLIPGLTDAHWHMMIAPNTLSNLESADPGLMYANAVAEAERTLLRGFTTVRDVGGSTFGMKAAIDTGVVPGPRVYPSGAFISQTSGHGDFAPSYARPKEFGGGPSHYEDLGEFVVADGVDGVLAAVREQLKKGASQIKIGAGGGVISDFDPIDSLQYTPEEMKAAVQAASDWGTYVAAHVYTVAGIRRALDTGVRSIEHGHLIDEPTVKLMAERDAWLSTQPLEPGDNPLSPEQAEKAQSMVGAWQRILGWAKQHGTKAAFGTDLLFSPDKTYMQNVMLTRLSQVYTNTQALKIATSGNCELFALSGERNPYKEAKLGVLQEGAWADMLLVEGDPTQNIDVLKDYERNLAVIVKDGKIHKNMLG